MLIILPLFYTFFLYKGYKREKMKYEKRNSENIITRVSSYSIKKKLDEFMSWCDKIDMLDCKWYSNKWYSKIDETEAQKKI